MSAEAIGHIQPIHPFPARMAPSVVWDSLPDNAGRPLCVVDAMAGSGTTVVGARAKGHQAIGCDTDPLALLIARAWSCDVDRSSLSIAAEATLERATKVAENVAAEQSYPSHCDAETRRFMDFWFDDTSRIPLTALSRCIRAVEEARERTLLWCALSRLIITKKSGVSLAMDVSHSRPHRKYTEANHSALLDRSILSQIEPIAKSGNFKNFTQGTKQNQGISVNSYQGY